MATRFTPSTLGSNVEAINVLADELHAVSGVGAATVNTTTTARTMTAAEFLSGVFVTTAAGALALTFPTAAALVAAMENAQVGSQAVLYLVNAGNNTLTITTNTGLTINGGHGTATLPTATSQIIIAKATNVTSGAEAVTLYPLLKTAS
jgi:hypothetical protein